MKQVFNAGGKAVVMEVPAPACGDNEVLVQNMFSVISVGTEGSSLKEGGKGIAGLVARARSNPELVRKAIDMVRREGIGQTLNVIRGQAGGRLTPLGYSSSGLVLEVGRNITDISPGDRVACAGAGYANHAEVVAVPRNLVCLLPAGVDFDEAAYTTLGAIALQGIRRAQLQLGDRVAVIGLGLLGQLACQILKTSGACVVGIDPVKERVELAGELGADKCFVSGADSVANVLKYTDGIGADAAIIYAATTSSEPVRQAMQMVRKRGRVVVVGAVGMELDRSPFYEKELDFLISCSYGPGRYDPTYEEQGIDYPIGYVRWTENRNMQEFLNLVADKKINVKRLAGRVFPIGDAEQAYGALTDIGTRPVVVLFKYEAPPEAELPRRIELKPLAKVLGKINVALIGAGSFAQAYHLPNLKRLPGYSLRAVVTKTGGNARSLAQKYGAQYCSTDYKEVLSDKDIDMVLIATRHNLHAPLVIEAAKAGKHIFVEKPIALTYEECREIHEVLGQSRVNLTIGFNRRFSPLAQRMKRLAEKRKSPLVINVRVNSPGMKKGHWVNDPVEGGGAIVSEACHFFDFLSWLVGAEPRRIYAEMISSGDPSLVDANNIVCTLSYADGSAASLTYSTVGDESFSKERIEVFMDGGVLAIDDFRELVIAGLGDKGKRLPRPEKGQLQLLQEFGKFLIGESEGADLPTATDGVRATIGALKALDALKTGKVQEFSYPK
jgi:predicted dehydrogenase